MEANWQTGLGKIAVWLIVEILLNILGLDTLANYSEFLFERKALAMDSPVAVVSSYTWFEQSSVFG